MPWNKEDIDEFASLLNQHWEISKKLDAGSTNTCIDQILAVYVKIMIDGKFISGAGGGGFLQVILKKGVTTGDAKHQRSERGVPGFRGGCLERGVCVKISFEKLHFVIRNEVNLEEYSR